MKRLYELVLDALRELLPYVVVNRIFEYCDLTGTTVQTRKNRVGLKISLLSARLTGKQSQLTVRSRRITSKKERRAHQRAYSMP